MNKKNRYPPNYYGHRFPIDFELTEKIKQTLYSATTSNATSTATSL